MARSRMLTAGLSALVVVSGLVALQAGAASAAESSKKPCTITGTTGDDVLKGTSGDDVICGLAGDDVIRGIGGDDVLIGGGGDDVLIGGKGEDEIYGGRGDDSFIGGDDEAQDATDDELLGDDSPQMSLQVITNLPNGTTLKWDAWNQSECRVDGQHWTDTIAPGWNSEHSTWLWKPLSNYCDNYHQYEIPGVITKPNGQVITVSAGAEVFRMKNTLHPNVMWFKQRKPYCDVKSGDNITCTATVEQHQGNSDSKKLVVTIKSTS